MKYCLRCGEIVADNSTSKDRTCCSECNTPYEEDDVTSEMFESFSESQKQKYADELFLKIKSSDIFDSKLFNEHIRSYGESSLYESWWYDKAKQLGATFILRYKTDEEIKQHIDREYGKNSPAYQQAVVQNCITVEKARKQERSNAPKCPICQSTNLSKISAVKKATKVGLFGIFGAGDIGKTWKCNNCGSKF